MVSLFKYVLERVNQSRNASHYATTRDSVRHHVKLRLPFVGLEADDIVHLVVPVWAAQRGGSRCPLLVGSQPCRILQHFAS
jgi:hypothetical protein